MPFVYIFPFPEEPHSANTGAESLADNPNVSTRRNLSPARELKITPHLSSARYPTSFFRHISTRSKAEALPANASLFASEAADWAGDFSQSPLRKEKIRAAKPENKLTNHRFRDPNSRKKPEKSLDKIISSISTLMAEGAGRNKIEKKPASELELPESTRGKTGKYAPENRLAVSALSPFHRPSAASHPFVQP